MPKFTDDQKLHADSLIQIREGIDDAVRRLSRDGVRFNHTKLKKVHVLNALALWFLRQVHPVQDRIMSATMPLLREHHDSQERLPIVEEVSGAVIEHGLALEQNTTAPEPVNRTGHNRVTRNTRFPKRGK